MRHAYWEYDCRRSDAAILFSACRQNSAATSDSFARPSPITLRRGCDRLRCMTMAIAQGGPDMARIGEPPKLAMAIKPNSHFGYIASLGPRFNGVPYFDQAGRFFWRSGGVWIHTRAPLQMGILIDWLKGSWDLAPLLPDEDMVDTIESCNDASLQRCVLL